MDVVFFPERGRRIEFACAECQDRGYDDRGRKLRGKTRRQQVIELGDRIAGIAGADDQDEQKERREQLNDDAVLDAAAESSGESCPDIAQYVERARRGPAESVRDRLVWIVEGCVCFYCKRPMDDCPAWIAARAEPSPFTPGSV